MNISGNTEGLSRDLLTLKFRVATHQNKYLFDNKSTKQLYKIVTRLKKVKVEPCVGRRRRIRPPR